jgi:signal transduction histidine kinase
MAEELLATDPAGSATVVRELGFEAEAALDELRSLAHGVYPSLLTDRGLADALRAVAAQAPLPVHLIASGVTRHPIEIESAAYFTCVEAVQNALKHARNAGGVWIRLHQTATRLEFEVRDDGLGFRAKDVDGRGLRNMHDRIEAIGGTLTVDARAGHGTRVAGSIPLS